MRISLFKVSKCRVKFDIFFKNLFNIFVGKIEYNFHLSIFILYWNTGTILLRMVHCKFLGLLCTSWIRGFVFFRPNVALKKDHIFLCYVTASPFCLPRMLFKNGTIPSILSRLCFNLFDLYSEWPHRKVCSWSFLSTCWWPQLLINHVIQ